LSLSSLALVGRFHFINLRHSLIAYLSAGQMFLEAEEDILAYKTF